MKKGSTDCQAFKLNLNMKTMNRTKINNMNRNAIAIGVGFVILLLILVFELPPTNSGSLLLFKKTEDSLKQAIKNKEAEISQLKARSETLEKQVTILAKEADSVAQLKNKVKTVYLEARTATDLNPDSLNLLNEVKVSREMIDRQEVHINALLEYSDSLDSLSRVRLEIIQKQDTVINDWSSRFGNMEEMKDQQIAQQKRKGNKKFLKGVGLGALVAIGLFVI